MIRAVVRRNQWLGLGVALLAVGCAGALEPAKPEVAVRDLGPAVEDQPGATEIRVKTLVNGLREPWGMDFLPDKRLLVTEKSGALKLIDLGTDQVRDIAGVPTVANAGQGGLMDVKVHPEFAVNQWVYFSYSVEENGLFSTRVSRAKLKGSKLREQQVLFTARPFFKERRHFGSRLLLDGGYLYITVGDRGNRDLAQSLFSHNGKVIRLTEDGDIPADNPFIGEQDALPEIWTLGHRNPQGLAKNRLTGDVWVSEHGPQGGDEINRLKAGANYGWPIITYGEEYGGGKIGEGTHKEGMEQPLSHFSPSLGTGGIDFYFAETYPGWEPSLIVAGLRLSLIARLALEGDGLGRQTRLLANFGMRIRDVQVGPDGLIYALADGSRLIRLQLQQ